MKIKRVKDGWKFRVLLPLEWIPHKHNFLKIGNGFLGNSIYVCKWCGKEKRGSDFKF